MDYKGIRYTVRTCIERQKWSVAIHPRSAQAIEKMVKGTRLEAERHAFSMIDTWKRKNAAPATRALSAVVVG
jgi:hypothetical protein